ncbi:MAG: glycosyltransferase family 2 protein [Bacilli bacterium]
MRKILSIVTVCYNSEKTIERCINSILPQLSESIEYIIIDGKSSDKTMEIVKKYKHKLRYISDEDTGIYNAMNKGIKMSKGEYVLFINSDDYLIEKSLEKVMPILSSKKYDVIYGDTLYVLNLENELYYRKVESMENLNKMNYGSILCHQSTFTRVDALKKIGMFDERYKIVGDWDSFIKLRNAGYTFKHINELICYFSIEGVSNTKFKFKEFKQVRKNNKVYKVINFYFLFDLKNYLLLKLKKFFKKYLGYDIEKVRVKKGYYKKLND